MILDTDIKTLRLIGLSKRKISYIKFLAESVNDGTINFQQLKQKSNKDVISSLSRVYGIGPQTSEMYLIFSLGREDVLSVSDSTIQHLIKLLYSLNKIPSKKYLMECFNRQKNYESIVSAYLWEAIKRGLTKTEFVKISDSEVTG